uniref:Sodium-dependent multivitamin transporter n=1 Tax=Megaselia scalaris TaxID=36166 RepID=T1H3J5_MEGSC
MMPLFVIDTMGKYPGLAGLFVSGIFSGSLSTVSSSVSSLAAVTLEDYLKPAYMLVMKKPMLETNTTLPSKIMACFYGLVCVGLAFLAGSLGGVLQASLTIFGVVGGPLLGVFTLGMFTTKANQKGVISGFLLGLVFGFSVGFGGPKPPPPVLDFSIDGCINNATITSIPSTHTVQIEEYLWLYRVSYLWYPVMCFVITLVLGYVLSLIYEVLKLDNNMRIYKDNYKLVINYDLFIPPLAKRLRSKNSNVKFDPEVNKELNEY